MVTISKNVLEAVSGGVERLLMTLADSSWSAGQLEDEITNSSWFNVPANLAVIAGIIFNAPNEEKYQKVFALLSVDSQFSSTQAGHA